MVNLAPSDEIQMTQAFNEIEQLTLKPALLF